MRLDIHITMRASLLLLALVVHAAEPDPERLVRDALDIYLESWEATKYDEYTERIRKIDLDQAGNEKKLDIKTFRVHMIDGSPHRRLISRFDKPISQEEEESERIKLKHELATREKESKHKREDRIRKYDKRRKEITDALIEIPKAFDFELLGSEEIGGRFAYVVGVSPRPDYKPESLRARVFTALVGKVWVDRASGTWLKLEAELMRPVTFGFFLVRLHKGARTEIVNEEIVEGVWSNKRLWYRASLRVGLIKGIAMDVEHLYSEQDHAGVESE